MLQVNKNGIFFRYTGRDSDKNAVQELLIEYRKFYR